METNMGNSDSNVGSYQPQLDELFGELNRGKSIGCPQVAYVGTEASLTDGQAIEREIIGFAVDVSQTRTDREIWDSASTAGNGQKFLDLWNGNFAQYYVC